MKRSPRFWLAIGLALAGALVLLVVPLQRTESFWWGTAGRSDDPFGYTITIDTEKGLIDSNIPESSRVSGVLSDLSFYITGQSGEGQVSIRATDPEGTLLIDETVGPRQDFVYPDDVGNQTGYLLVTVDNPQQIPAPGGAVIFVVETEVPLNNAGPQTVTGFEVEPYALGDIAELDSGRSDSCARLDLPIELPRGSVLRCTYQVELSGQEGTIEQSVAAALTPSNQWSSDTVTIEFGNPELAWPEEPLLVHSSFGDPEAPPPHRGAITTDLPGTYTITLLSDEGSTEFALTMSAERTTRQTDFAGLSPNRELALGLIAAAGLAALGAFAGGSSLRRLGGLALSFAGGAVPVAVLLTDDDQWYWNEGTHLIWIVALGLVGLGSSLLVAPNRIEVGSKRHSPMAIGGLALLVLLTSALVLTTAGLSPAYDGSFWGGDWVGYNGDYSVMGLHVYALALATPLLALTAALLTAVRGNNSRPAREAGETEFESLTKVMSGVG